MRFDEMHMRGRCCRSGLAAASAAWLTIRLFTLISLLGFPSFPQSARPSTPCDVGVRAPGFGFWTWPSDTRVKVYILSGGFKREEIPYLLIPLGLWDAEWKSTGSGVRLDYAGITSNPRQCQNCLTIMRATVFNQKTRHGSEFQAYSEQGNQLVSYAAILIDPALTNPKALTNAVAHELGHGLGLLDCYGCMGHSTVMNKLKSLNISNEMQGPTFCDIEQVRKGYKQLRIRVGPAPIMTDTVDDGEEPIEDDTPIVVPN